MGLRCLVLAMLVFTNVTVLPVAHATPPDQSWLGGFYDDEDFDDVVVLLTSSVALIDTQCVVGSGMDVPYAQTPALPEESVCVAAALAIDHTRAPPAA